MKVTNGVAVDIYLKFVVILFDFGRSVTLLSPKKHARNTPICGHTFSHANAMPAKDACSTSRILNVSSPKKMAAQSTGNCTEWIASAAPQKHNCIEGPKQDAPGAARTYPLNEAALECRQQGQTIGMKKKNKYIYKDGKQ